MGDPLLEMAHVFEMRQRGRRALEEGNKKEDLQGLFQQQSATSFSPASLMVYSSDTHTQAGTFSGRRRFKISLLLHSEDMEMCL